jgi:hypothetical protein
MDEPAKRVNARGVIVTEDAVLDVLDMMIVYMGFRDKMVRPAPRARITPTGIKGATRILLLRFKRIPERDDNFYQKNPMRWETLVQNVGVSPHTMTVNDRARFDQAYGSIVSLVHEPRTLRKRVPQKQNRKPKIEGDTRRFRPDEFIDTPARLKAQYREEEPDNSDMVERYYKRHKSNVDTFSMQ